jgi:pimeloyl-ACP methyl ester carboxylesterase
MRKIILFILLFLCFSSLIPIKSVKAQNMEKTVLILHGWPQPVTKDSMYYKYFEEKGYLVVAPQLFIREFVLDENEAKNYIEKQLAGRKPDVIVGISLGGLLAPVFAKDYPNAKLVLIATGPKLEPQATGFRMLLDVAQNKRVLSLLNVLKFLPQKVLFSFYEFINPFRGNKNQREIYIKDMKDNFKYIISIPVEEESEIVNFVSSTDNTGLLKTLKNKAIIFAGHNDLMMPTNLGEEFHKLLVNSQLMLSDGGHFNVFTENSFRDLDNFLKE